MKLDLPYLDKSFPLEFPDENLLAVVEPNEFPVNPPEKILREALLRSCDGGGLASFLRGGQKILVIINDATRPTPTEAMLKALFPFFVQAGLGPENLTLLVAAGAHRAPNEEEYRQILGGFYDKLRSRCVPHDSRTDAGMVDLGHTRNNTPIVLNKRIFEADRIIVTGSVEPHYFAGFTGGRKAFLPGIASCKTGEL